MPAVSVLLPVHNGGQYIETAVRSILTQTFRDFELLILDDGSTDGTAAILARLSTADERIRVISRENRGLVASLNELLGQARGRYCARMDADDVALPRRLERQVHYLNTHPDVVLLGGQIELIDAGSRRLGVVGQPLTHEEIEDCHLRGHTSICHPAAIFDQAKVQLLGGYRSELFPAEDLDLWLRLGEVGCVANLDELVLQYRIHDQSISSLNQAKQVASWHQVAKDAWNRRGIAGDYICESTFWREEDGRHSRHRFALKYGWMAWKNGHRQVASYYGWRAIRTRPLRGDSWRLLLVSMMRRYRRQELN